MGLEGNPDAKIADCSEGNLLIEPIGVVGYWYRLGGDFGDDRLRPTAEDLLEQTMRAVTAYSYRDVPLLDGSTYVEGATPEASDFEVKLAVTPSSSGMLKVEAVLFDKRTQQEIRRFVTYRGR